MRGYSVGSDIAIDDVSFSGCTLAALCPEDAFTCGGLECIHKDEQCDFINQCSDGEDEAYCGEFGCYSDSYLEMRLIVVSLVAIAILILEMRLIVVSLVAIAILI